MRKCIYPECSHDMKNNAGCKMHKFPKQEEFFREWVAACEMYGTPKKMPACIYVCSCHFVDGGPSKQNPVPICYKNPLSSALNALMDRASSPNVEEQFSPAKSVPGHEHAVTVSPDQAHADCFSGKDANENHMPMQIGCDASSGQNDSFSDLAVPLSSPVTQPTVSSSSPATGRSGSTYSLKKVWKRHSSSNKKSGAKKRRSNRDFGCQSDLALMSYEKSASWSDEDFLYFTGISRTSFGILFNLLGGVDVCSKLKYSLDAHTPTRICHSSHSTKGKLFMTLVRLRRGYTLRDMRMLFHLSESVISAIFLTWIRFLALKFKSLEGVMFCTVAAQKRNPPDCYKPFPNLRCVVDSTEIKIQKPDNMEQQSNTYSSYKCSNCVKFLVCTSLYGGLSYISNGMEGGITDRQLFLRSGIMEYLNEGEAVMADRGFDLETDLNKVGVDLIIPPFLGDRISFSKREMMLGKCISTSRIHVETFIGRMKHFRLIRHVVPNTMIDIVSDIVRVCACLVNFSNPFIKWSEDNDNNKKT